MKLNNKKLEGMQMNVTQWAIKHGVSAEALQELNIIFGIHDNVIKHNVDLNNQSEKSVQNRERLKASEEGSRLWRNNIGAAKLADGRFLRWGLCNDSEKINKRIKSSDLIGIKPILIKQEHVGSVIGQFMAIETKPSYWRYSGTDHEIAQLAFIQLISSLGGDARFSNG